MRLPPAPHRARVLTIACAPSTQTLRLDAAAVCIARRSARLHGIVAQGGAHGQREGRMCGGRCLACTRLQGTETAGAAERAPGASGVVGGGCSEPPSTRADVLERQLYLYVMSYFSSALSTKWGSVAVSSQFFCSVAARFTNK